MDESIVYMCVCVHTRAVGDHGCFGLVCSLSCDLTVYVQFLGHSLFQFILRDANHPHHEIKSVQRGELGTNYKDDAVGFKYKSMNIKNKNG